MGSWTVGGLIEEDIVWLGMRPQSWSVFDVHRVDEEWYLISRDPNPSCYVLYNIVTKQKIEMQTTYCVVFRHEIYMIHYPNGAPHSLRKSIPRKRILTRKLKIRITFTTSTLLEIP